jgi:very-short-patch-repair endonuclease
MADQLARDLRRSMTPQEVKLWVRLRELRQQGYHFRRQAPRGRYILDFICLRSRLIVEVDGGQHGFDAHAARDAARDAHFTERGFRTLRFWNNEIDRNLDGVVETIWHALQAGGSEDRSQADALAILAREDDSAKAAG